MGLVPEGVVDEIGEDGVQQGARELKTGVGVALDQPDLEVLIDDEIKPVKLVC